MPSTSKSLFLSPRKLVVIVLSPEKLLNKTSKLIPHMLYLAMLEKIDISVELAPLNIRVNGNNNWWCVPSRSLSHVKIHTDLASNRASIYTLASLIVMAQFKLYFIQGD